MNLFTVFDMGSFVSLIIFQRYSQLEQQQQSLNTIGYGWWCCRHRRTAQVFLSKHTENSDSILGLITSWSCYHGNGAADQMGRSQRSLVTNFCFSSNNVGSCVRQTADHLINPIKESFAMQIGVPEILRSKLIWYLVSTSDIAQQ